MSFDKGQYQVCCCCCWVSKSCLTVTPGLQHTRLPWPSPSPRVCSNPCPLSQWCYPTVSSSVVPFSSCPQSFPASGSFPMSQFFTPGGQSAGASASVLPVNVQGWFSLGWTGLISLPSKGIRCISCLFCQLQHQVEQHGLVDFIQWHLDSLSVMLPSCCSLRLDSDNDRWLVKKCEVIQIKSLRIGLFWGVGGGITASNTQLLICCERYRVSVLW